MPLTHHRDGGKAICHYCDYTIATPPWCPACRFDGIRYGGLGTQRLEVEVKARFPDACVARMDSDTMRRPGSHQRVLSAFRAGEVDILLGTQMIAKGLDFPNVLLVGVINADSALHFPDFRAAERTFQLVTQVAGRTGRGDRGGRVIVQTFSPSIQRSRRHLGTTTRSLPSDEMNNRRKFNYPPLGSVGRIIIRGSDENETEAVAETLLSRLEAARSVLGCEVRILVRRHLRSRDCAESIAFTSCCNRSNKVTSERRFAARPRTSRWPKRSMSSMSSTLIRWTCFSGDLLG